MGRRLPRAGVHDKKAADSPIRNTVSFASEPGVEKATSECKVITVLYFASSLSLDAENIVCAVSLYAGW